MFSSTGDGGTLTEVTDGNQRMNCDTSGKQILKTRRWALDNHVGRPRLFNGNILFHQVTFQQRSVMSAVLCWSDASDGLYCVKFQF